MKNILRVLRIVLDFIGFFVVTFGLIFLTARLIIPHRHLESFINCTGAFLRKNLKNDPFEYQGEPNKFRKFLANTELLFKDAYSPSIRDSTLSDNVLGLRLNFPNYAMLFSLMNEIFIHKIYAFKSEQKAPFIIDAGSNIGISILFFKKMYPHATIIGFEPSKQNFEFLEKNIRDNKLTDVHVFNKALSDKEAGEIKLYNAGTVMGSVSESEEMSNYEIVETTLLSGYINQKVDLLKMDIEGAEYEVFQDLFDQDKLKFVDKIIMEYHNPQKHLSKLLDIFDKSEFHYEIKDNLIYAYKK